MKLLVVAIVGILFVGFLWSLRAQDPEYQASDYEYTGHFDNWILELLENACIDPNDSWQIECPECLPEIEGRGRIVQTIDSWELWNFRTGWSRLSELKPGESAPLFCGLSEDIDKPGFGLHKLYCAACMYPIGTDWKVW